jgi:peptide/nickel transport system substrate-binding protein
MKEISMPQQKGPFWESYNDLKAGRITRRQFIARATALGVALPVTLFVLNAVKVEGTSAQDTDILSVRPTVGTENQQRGAGGELRILQWQAATVANIHRSQGTKDSLASSLVSEPLISFAPDATLLPTLVQEVPSIENGLLSEDLMTVTYNLLEGVVWSDGEPFTAEDVVFTWQWIMDESNASVNFTLYQVVENVEALSETQVRVTLREPSLAWYIPFSSSYTGGILPRHILGGDDADAANEAFLTNPIGTGPYRIETFQENDQVIYVINENYREPNKPYFSSVNLKGGGDASSAAQAVLQTGDWDFAWNLQVEPEILRQMQEAGFGTLQASPATSVERLLINFSDPNVEVDGERSSLEAPHPFFTDINVRRALSLATDRQTISDQFYQGGDLEPPATNILTGLPAYESPNTSWEFDLEAAAQTLEDAGWVMDGNVRAKDGVQLNISYFTSINSVRQKTQAVHKRDWESIGFRVQLGQVDAGVFFDSSPGNEQNYGHAYRDLQMYTNGPVSPFPILYMQDWYAGPDNVNVAQRANEWSGVNNQRYVNPEYDAAYDRLNATTDAEEAAELFIQLNDIVVNDIAIIPQVARAGELYAISNRLVADNVAATPWETLYWNIANWTAVEQ